MPRVDSTPFVSPLFLTSLSDHIHSAPFTESDSYIYTVRYRNRIGSVYKKARYIEYSDDSFAKTVPQPAHLGILGPTIRAEVGDTIKIVFKNLAGEPYGIHSHGVKYVKEHEAAHYNHLDHSMPGTAVQPGETFTYVWEVPERAGPGPADGNCSLWAYHPHHSDPGDMYVGLYGALIVYKKGLLDPETDLPTDVDEEFVLHFLVFDENNSHYLRDNINKFAPELQDRLPKDASTPFVLGGEKWTESNLMHAINGRMYGNLNGLEMKLGSKTRWHMMAFGTEVDIHTAHWHAHSLLENGHRKDVVELLPASFHSLTMEPDTAGTWLLHCHVLDHQIAGMSVLYHVRDLNETTSLDLESFKAKKEDMNAPPAPRPPLAEPIYKLSDASRFGITSALFALVSVLFIY